MTVANRPKAFFYDFFQQPSRRQLKAIWFWLKTSYHYNIAILLADFGGILQGSHCGMASDFARLKALIMAESNFLGYLGKRYSLALDMKKSQSVQRNITAILL